MKETMNTLNLGKFDIQKNHHPHYEPPVDKHLIRSSSFEIECECGRQFSIQLTDRIKR